MTTDEFANLAMAIALEADYASPREDPSPLMIADAICSAALAGYGGGIGARKYPEVAAIKTARYAVTTGYGDWCGGRIEPEGIATFMADRFQKVMTGKMEPTIVICSRCGRDARVSEGACSVSHDLGEK